MIPLKLAMAREIARKIIEKPSRFGFRRSSAAFQRVETFLGEHWDRQWGVGNYAGWEESHYWEPIKIRLPEILEKLCTENVQESE